MIVKAIIRESSTTISKSTVSQQSGLAWPISLPGFGTLSLWYPEVLHITLIHLRIPRTCVSIMSGTSDSQVDLDLFYQYLSCQTKACYMQLAKLSRSSGSMTILACLVSIDLESSAQSQLMILFTALIVVDPIREYLVVEKKWKIWGIELVDSLTTEACYLDEVIKKTMIGSIIVADATEVLTSLHGALDDIDLSLSNDDILHRSLHVWRTRFGLWRHDLQRSRVSVINML